MAFIPENELEHALVRATKEPAARPEFYRLLLESDLFVIGDTGQPVTSDGTRDLSVGEQLRIASVQHNGRDSHPVFTSLTRLNSFIQQECSYLALYGRALFEAVPGASFMLNPGSDYGKELLPKEIEQLLHPEKTFPHTVTIDQPTRVAVGQPAVYPQALVDALRASFVNRPDVLAAYLLQIAFEGSNDPPHPLIGVETIGDWRTISTEVGRVVATAAPGLVVDVVPINRTDETDTLTNSLLQIAPFYLRPLSTA